MRKIIEILSIESWLKGKDTHWRTTAMLDNQEEARGYGKDFEVGDEVEAWWDDEFDMYKMQKGKKVK